MQSFGEADMTREEMTAYLQANGKFAAVASSRRDGSPFVAPYGFWFDGTDLYLSTAEGRGLAARLRRDPRVSITVFDEQPLHAFVTFAGAVEEVDDADHAISLRIHHRYPKPGIEDTEAYDRDWLATRRVVFRLRVGEYASMNQRKVTNKVLLAMNPAEAQRLGRDTADYR